MAVKEDYTLEDVIEVINLNNATLGIELAGIRTNINIILNPELTSATLVENKDLLKTLLKILDKAFNSYLMNENLYNFIVIGANTNFNYFNDFKANVEELISNLHELATYEELTEVPEAKELEITAVNLGNNIKKLAICYGILNNKEV